MKSIRLGALALLILLLASTASAQTWAEVRTFTADGTTTPRLDAWLSGQVTGSLGSFAWLQIDPNYAQAYAGASISPKPWLQFGAGGGVESGQAGRFGSFIWVGSKQQSALGIFEAAGSGPWWKAEYNWNLNDQIGIGFITERFKGSGLRVAVHVPHTPVTIWVAPLYRSGSLAAIVGLRMKM